MKKPTDIRRPVNEINYSNRLNAIPAESEQREANTDNDFSNSGSEREELPAPQNLYDKIIKFCCSWNFVFIFLALLSAYVIYSLLQYWVL